jgi:hypothetical protein
MQYPRGPLKFSGANEAHRSWTIAAIIAVVLLLCLALAALTSCVGGGQETNPQQNTAPIAAPATATNLAEQITNTINAAMAAKTVNGNMIQNQGITNAQFGCLAGIVCGFGLILIGALWGPASKTESVIMIAGGIVLLFGTVFVMIGGHVDWPRLGVSF